MNKENLILRDVLAIERTKLANERTFLAYFRTAVVFFASGIGIISIHFFKKIDYIGYGLVFLSPFVLFWGIYRFVKVKKSISRYYIGQKE